MFFGRHHKEALSTVSCVALNKWQPTSHRMAMRARGTRFEQGRTYMTHLQSRIHGSARDDGRVWTWTFHQKWHSVEESCRVMQGHRVF